MLEKDIESKLTKAVKAEKGRAYKFVSPGNSGVPDRIVVLPGGCIGFVELKQKGKIPTKLQDLQIKRLKDAGFYVTILDDAAGIPAVIAAIREHGRRKAYEV